MPGPGKKPVELKILRMTAKKAENLLKRVSPTPGPLGDAPEWLTADQKLDWAYCLENAPRDVLKRIDKTVLAGFIVAADTHRRAAIAMQQAGLVMKSPKVGLAMQNPYLPIVNRQMLLMMRAAGELGFTPCSRARIDAGKPPANHMTDDWEDVG